ncbi:hypothetical protein P154DRAFT_578024 [Amniculicola lignicola CBS 123094]|uniref:NADH dehydrogenase [ubiquinone] 1 beta subcomplex subunit 4 n=1 Tax=Amniculicola lignicola CBS 123094 TaxID=1392246 RepID=A0A6A5W960_9PLEO|nr:hypothetical protein P154DRAFT_578024 [Amniculicola lignicola CBS 123094]
MAGNSHGKPHHAPDPAYLKWYDMTINRHKYFRWTGRTAWISFAYMILVPSIVGTIGYKYEGKWDFRGKRRGDLLSEF